MGLASFVDAGVDLSDTVSLVLHYFRASDFRHDLVWLYVYRPRVCRPRSISSTSNPTSLSDSQPRAFLFKPASDHR